MEARAAAPRAPAILTFILADMISFGLFFAFFMAGRVQQTALFNASALQLDPRFGLFNTLVLVTSGWMVVQAVAAARRGDRKATRMGLLLAFAVGSGFAVAKVMEYREKFAHGISMLTNDFFMFYFVLTGVHFLHFVIGMAVLAMLWVRAANEPVEGPLFGWIESGALYWHMVDLLWIALFPMLYLLGRL